MIQLTNRFVTVLDDEDYERFSSFVWFKIKRRDTYYVMRSPDKKLLHRLILDAPDHLQVDHKDGNGLDNRRKNLRLATPTQNNMNRALDARNISGYSGITWYPERGKWRARISAHNQTKFLGFFSSLEDAIETRLKAEKELFGEFSPNL